MPRGRNSLRIVRKYYPKVSCVVDAKRDVGIEVTAADCKGSKRKAPNDCAMARAFERTYDGAIISVSTAYLIKGEKAFRYHVPDAVGREIVSFDRHGDFAAGAYYLTVPPYKLGSDTRGGHADSRRNHQAREKAKNHHTEGIRSL